MKKFRKILPILLLLIGVAFMLSQGGLLKNLSIPSLPSFGESSNKNVKNNVDLSKVKADCSSVTLLPNTEYNVSLGEAYNYTTKTDTKARIVSAKAEQLFYKKHDGRLCDSLPKPIGDKAGDQYDAGHLIGDQFDGISTQWNTTAQVNELNRGPVKWLEMALAEEVQKGKKVSLDVQVSYLGENQVPSSYNYTYTVEGKTGKVTFLNSTDFEGLPDWLKPSYKQKRTLQFQT